MEDAEDDDCFWEEGGVEVQGGSGMLFLKVCGDGFGVHDVGTVWEFNGRDCVGRVAGRILGNTGDVR